MKKITRVLLALGFTFGHCVASAQSPAIADNDSVGKVMTVNGPIAPERLGQTLMHEHIFIDARLPDESNARWALAQRTRPLNAMAVNLYNAPLTLNIIGDLTLGRENRDNYLLEDEQRAVAEVREFLRYGGGSIVELTVNGQQRSPEKLRRVSSATGVQVVMGTGWAQEAWYPEDMDARSVESLTLEMVRDLREGVGETGIRAGIIGSLEILDTELSDNEIKVLRAAARASLLTGAAISLAIAVTPDSDLSLHNRVLDLLASEGADLKRVIVGHVDPLVAKPELLKSLSKRGVMLQFDLLGRPTTVNRGRATDTAVAWAIIELLKDGYSDKILLSQGIGTKARLKAYGGSGYSFISEYFLRFMLAEGATEKQLQTLMVDNPKRLLTLVKPKQLKLTSR